MDSYYKLVILSLQDPFLVGFTRFERKGISINLIKTLSTTIKNNRSACIIIFFTITVETMVLHGGVY